MRQGMQLFFEGVARVNDEVAYGASANFNGLFEIELKTGKCTFIGMFENERPDMDRLFFSACTRDDNIYFIPNAAKCIHKFSVKSKTLKSFPLVMNNNRRHNLSMKYCEAFIYEGNIIAIGAAWPNIIVIDQNDDIKYIELPTKERVLFRRGTFYKGKYYVNSIASKLLLEYDMKSTHAVIKEMPKNIAKAWNVSCLGNRIYFLPDNLNDDISYYDIEENNYINLKKNGTEYLLSYCINNELIAVPKRKAPFLSILQNGEIEEKNVIAEVLEDEFVGFAFEMDEYIYLVKTKDGIYPRSQNGCESLRLNKKTMQISKVRFTFSDGFQEFENQLRKLSKPFFENGIVKERPGSLEYFIKTIIE